MNALNRVLAVVFLLGLIVVLVLGIYQPLLVIDWGGGVVAATKTLVQTNYAAYLAGTGVLLFGALLLLVLELRRPRRDTVRVRQVSGGIVELATESVTRSLEYHLTQLPGVVEAHSAVVSKGSAVKVSLDVETDPDAEIPAKTEEIVQLTHEVVEGKLGLKVASVRVSVSQAPHSQEGTTRPMPAPGELPLGGPA